MRQVVKEPKAPEQVTAEEWCDGHTFQTSLPLPPAPAPSSPRLSDRRAPSADIGRCDSVMKGEVAGEDITVGLDSYYPELSYFVGLGVGEDLSLRDDLAARRRGVLGAMRLACWLAQPKPRTHAKPIAHGCDIDSDAEPWLASLATAWREEVQSAAHLNVLLSLLAVSSLAHVAALMVDVHAGPNRADGSSRHDETRPPRSADVLGGGVSANLLAAEDAAEGEAPQGGVALPSLACHRTPQRGLLCALLRASLDLVGFCRGELP